jgi:lysophospholipase L1-like esterase
VVVLGDSLIRNAEGALRRDLAGAGYGATFVCWGGKETTWGMQQLQLMRARGLLPQCLVINLGTNDIKLDRGHQTPQVLQSRLVSLLSMTAGVPHVLLVSIWGKKSSLMPAMDGTLPVYPAAIALAGIGQLVDWADVARAHPSYVEAAGVHDTAAGSSVRAQLIASAVAQHCG